MATKSKSEKLLEDIWLATAEGIATILKETAPADLSAAKLATIAKFLSDNNVRKDTMDDTKGAAEIARQDVLSDTLVALSIDSNDIPLPLPEPSPDHAIIQED